MLLLAICEITYYYRNQSVRQIYKVISVNQNKILPQLLVELIYLVLLLVILNSLIYFIIINLATLQQIQNILEKILIFVILLFLLIVLRILLELRVLSFVIIYRFTYVVKSQTSISISLLRIKKGYSPIAIILTNKVISYLKDLIRLRYQI